MVAADLAILDHDHFARFDLAQEVSADNVQGACLGCQRIAITDLAQNQRAHAQRIPHADQLGAGHGNHREGAFNAAQGVFHPFRHGALQRPGHQMNDAFAVRRALEDGSPLDQFPAQGGGIGDVAIMGNRRAAC